MTRGDDKKHTIIALQAGLRRARALPRRGDVVQLLVGVLRSPCAALADCRRHCRVVRRLVVGGARHIQLQPVFFFLHTKNLDVVVP